MILPGTKNGNGEHLFAISSLKIVEIPCEAHDYTTSDGKRYYCKLCKQEFASFPGDVTCDGTLSKLDALQILLSLASETDLDLADFDNDGSVDFKDVVKVFRKAKQAK